MRADTHRAYSDDCLFRLRRIFCHPQPGKTSQSNYFRAKMQARFPQRTAIEPLIGHLKDQSRQARRFLKGFVGDQVNLLLAAAAWNSRKWLRVAALLCLQILRGLFATGQFRLCAVGR